MKIKFTCIENLCLVMAVPEKLFKKLSIINPYHAANLYVLHSSAIFIDLICRITVTIMYLPAEWKTLNNINSDQLASQKNHQNGHFPAIYLCTSPFFIEFHVSMYSKHCVSMLQTLSFYIIEIMQTDLVKD